MFGTGSLESESANTETISLRYYLYSSQFLLLPESKKLRSVKEKRNQSSS